MFSILARRPHFWLLCSFWARRSLALPGLGSNTTRRFSRKSAGSHPCPDCGSTNHSLARKPLSRLFRSIRPQRRVFSFASYLAAIRSRSSRKDLCEHSRLMNLGTSTPVTQEIVLEITPHLDAVTVSDSGYQLAATSSGTKTLTAMRDIPQSVTVVTQELIRDQMMMSIGDVVRYVPGITAHQGENNRDQVIIRGNSSSADFFVNGVRDDVQYYRDLYNLERVEALKGPNAMIFGRGGMGGVINRVTKEAGFTPLREISLMGGSFGSNGLPRISTSRSTKR